MNRRSFVDGILGGLAALVGLKLPPKKKAEKTVQNNTVMALASRNIPANCFVYFSGTATMTGNLPVVYYTTN